MKPYRLLRNNKESGPYSADELIQLGLKAYDLIWMDGKSASWRYASEIAELKPYAPIVEEQPFDRFYKKPAAVTASVKEEPVADMNVVSSMNAIPSIAVKQVKPRIRIKADSAKIEIPVPQPQLQETFAEKEVIKPIEQKPIQKQREAIYKEPIKETVKLVQTTDTPDWKDMWLNWEQEKKAVSDASKVDVAGTMKSVNRYYSSVNEKSEVLETKFSQSLDE